LLALSFDGYSLAALAVAIGGILILVALLRRNTQVGVTRFGVFIERERFEDENTEDTKIMQRHWPGGGDED
jgi:hypothetical protein